MKEAKRACLSCKHAFHDPSITPDQRLALAVKGEVQAICLFNPPSVSAIATPKGVMTVQGNPTVNATTMSCSHWEATNATH